MLDLSGNHIQPDGVKSLANALRKNKVLSVLVLAYNRIGSSGTKYLADLLKVNAVSSFNLIVNQFRF